MILLSLADGMALAPAGPGSVTATHVRRGRATLAELDAGVVAALLRLSDGPVSHAALVALARTTDPQTDQQRLDRELRRLAGGGQLHFGCLVAGEPALTATLTSELALAGRDTPGLGFAAPQPGSRFRLSRFALTHLRGDELTVYSPLTWARVRVDQPAPLSLLFALRRPADLDTLCRATGQPPAAVADMLELLCGVGLAGTVDADGALPEETDPVLRQRELPDVLLHTASRSGLTQGVTGRTLRFLDVLPPAPAVTVAPTGALRLPLPVPDLEVLVAKDPPLAQVMEQRRTARRFADRPLHPEELGEFLYRVARVRELYPAGRGGQSPYATSDRPYPSGGAAYDLEVYLTVVSVTGIAPGFYRYEPLEHELTLVSAEPRLVLGMLREAYLAARGINRPPVLVTLASRFTRLSWAYESIAYATTLKHVGVLYSTMYLTATAMGLGGCALGRGDSVLFARLTGEHPAVQSSVGEFLLGALPDGTDDDVPGGAGGAGGG